MNFIISQLLLLTLGFPNPEVPVFEQEVRLILKTHCFECHGEGEKLKGGLDLRLKKLIVTGGETGPGIVVNDPEKIIQMGKASRLKAELEFDINFVIKKHLEIYNQYK